jgi:hypothetical protein
VFFPCDPATSRDDNWPLAPCTVPAGILNGRVSLSVKTEGLLCKACLSLAFRQQRVDFIEKPAGPGNQYEIRQTMAIRLSYFNERLGLIVDIAARYGAESIRPATPFPCSDIRKMPDGVSVLEMKR